ncbi:Alpha/Beta hydrolase protein [Endogone sp. FLAS-F59071]|nr:Alpha/Beta hydrolase protein [Endogone sp. FLAS-F59071]|eukprot:RUS20713.1 Alpha/Beta hydrolase protein [Endogone sp. FLAS-F59071]
MPFAELEDIVISYQDTGVPTNTEIDYTTIVLVHGHKFNSRELLGTEDLEIREPCFPDTWDLLLPRLSADYRLIAYDRRRYGQTRASPLTDLDSSDLLKFIAHLRSVGAVPSKLVMFGWSAGCFGPVLAVDDTPQDQSLPFDAILLYDPPFFTPAPPPRSQNFDFGRLVAGYFDPITAAPIPDRNSIDIMPQEILRLCYDTDAGDPGIPNTIRSRINPELVSRVIDRVPIGLLYGTLSLVHMVVACKKVIELAGKRETFFAMEMEDTNHFAMTDKPDMFAERVRQALDKLIR